MLLLVDHTLRSHGKMDCQESGMFAFCQETLCFQQLKVTVPASYSSVEASPPWANGCRGILACELVVGRAKIHRGNALGPSAAE